MNKLRIAVVVLSLSLFGPLNASAETLSPASKIAKVTVYPGSAHLTRQAELDLPAGTHSIIFKDIVPNFDQDSLAVAGEGKAAVKIYGAYVKQQFLKEAADARVRELEKKIEELQDRIQAENTNYSLLDEKRKFMESFRSFSSEQLPKENATKMPPVESLQGLLKFYGDELKGIEEQKQEVQKTIRELVKEKQVLENELNRIRSHQVNQQRSVVVDLECEKPGRFRLDVSYLVHGASWRPVYDGRTDFEKASVDLAAYGLINQNTGEDWIDVDLTLSTAQPALGGRMPYVAPWILTVYQPQPAAIASGSMQNLRKAVMDAAAPAETVQYEAFYSKDKEELGLAAATMATSQIQSKGLSVVYRIARPATIKSDGTENKFPVISQKLAANFEYSTYPRGTPFVYLGSRVTNSKDLQLLPGEVNLFLENDFVGKSSIDAIGPGEEFDLYLGVDESVKIKREQIAKKVDDTLFGGISSGSVKTTYTYKITAENYKNKNIKLILFESMPVPENDRVKVKIYDVNVEPKEKDWKDRKGVWRWEFDLKPTAKQEIQYSFTVEHPKDMQLTGL